MAKNVLLIEYEQRDRSRVLSLLSSPDFAVTETRDGDEGLAAFAGSKFDVVVLSGKLPRHSSSDLIREIRNKGGLDAPPIVLLAANYAGSNTTADAQQVGAFEIVPKPFSDEALVSAVRSALESTDRAARTMKAPTASRLTSTDIFSDLLDELGREPGAAQPKAPAPPKPPPPMPSVRPPGAAASPKIDADLERRLHDTLSGVTGARPAAGTAPPPPRDGSTTQPGRSATRSARPGEDIDRMLTETLRIPIPKKEAPPAPSAPRATGSTRAEPREAVVPEGPDRFGQYEVLERVASGGMAELFRARRTGVEGFQKIVAIKKILPHIADNDEFITMFADEAKLAAQLNHPNIVHIYDLGKIQAGGYFIAMEYVEGTDLRTVLRTGRDKGLPLPVPLAVYVATKVASALDYAHRRRDARGEELHIVHRDVSPQNILISHEGEIKLCDFGIAKADRKVSRTESGSLKGKLQYMSPEQAWGKPIDHRSDLFSLGCVLHEMLTGERLFRGDSDMVVLELVRKAEISPPSRLNPDVGPALDAIVVRALAREPADRYASGSEMLRDLESVLYSYTPAPGSADLAIYLNRLQEAAVPAQPTAVAEPVASVESKPAPEAAPRARKKEKARAAAPPAPKIAPPPPPTAVPPPAAAPAASPVERGVFGSFSAARVESERNRRTPLYIAIAAAVLLGGILAFALTRRGSEEAPDGAAAPVATALPAAAPMTAEAVPTAAALDPKAIQQEVQRQLAQKRQEQLVVPARPAPLSRAAARAATAAALAAAPEIARAEPTAVPVPTAAPPEPTEVAVAVAAPPAAAPAEEVVVREEPTPVPRREAAPPPAPREAEVSRGDLVGPGPGVVEPALVAPPRVPYPPMARQQRVAGRVVVLVLVDEGGSVADARLQKGIGGRSGIDGVVVEAVRGSRFRPATKNGVPVKMWRTVVVDVKP
jgi:TonB family protein